MLQAFIDSVSRFGNTFTYNGLIRNMRYVRLTPHRLELRAVISDYMRRHGFQQIPQVRRLSGVGSHHIFVN
jgi:hypothetical protein